MKVLETERLSLRRMTLDDAELMMRLVNEPSWLEFIGDKIPYVDSAWDAISTFIRPVVGATIGVLLAGDASSLDQAVLGVVGGGSALASHTVKAGSRLAVNASPEPFTNIGLSLGEDGLVLGVVSLAVAHPHLAALIAGVLLLIGLVVVYLLGRLIRRGWRRWKACRW